MKVPFLKLTIVSFCLLLVSSGCMATKGEGFAIYLTRDNIPPSQMEALSHVALADQSIIGINDIISYNKQTHELKLTQRAFEHISQLELPTSGKSFLVWIRSLCIGLLSGLRCPPNHLMG
jgi:hypothetical protein